MVRALPPARKTLPHAWLIQLLFFALCAGMLVSSTLRPCRGGSEGAVALAASRWFPQVQQCGGDRWKAEYAALHHAIVTGAAPPRYLASVDAEAGVADRLTGWITLFWTAVLQRRAFTAVTYDRLPGFAAACDMPWVNWTHPERLAPEVVDPLKYTYRGERGHCCGRTYENTSVDTSLYFPWYLITHYREEEKDVVTLQHYEVFATSNLSAFPPSNPDIPYIVAGANRGRTFRMAADNPYHRAQFWEWGVAPGRAFMCGFFYLCSPNEAVRKLYGHFWEQLEEPGMLKIGIQVRVGDNVLDGRDVPGETALQQAAPFFKCAAALEKAFALPGQKVVWYLNADSHALRKAAKAKYGSKLLTDTETVMRHPDCRHSPGHHCKSAAFMDELMIHSMGAMLTFSKADYHVISQYSGFGRLPAWLSGKWDNVYEISQFNPRTCIPGQHTPLRTSATYQAGV
jgi:hypothetical protein